jgi:hypothetical protein
VSLFCSGNDISASDAIIKEAIEDKPVLDAALTNAVP